MKRTGLYLAGAVVSALALSACSSQAPKADIDLDPSGLGDEAVQEAMAEMYDAAVEAGEDSVVVYGPGEALYAPVYDIFMERYPEISVTGEYIFGAELSTRLDSEFGSGKHLGSVQTGGPAVTLATKSADRCEAWEPISDEAMRYYLPEPIDEDGEFRAVVGYPFGIAYNTEAVDGAPPAGWADLADPKWKGDFVLSDPRMVGATSQTIGQLLAGDYFTEQWVEDIKANEPEIRAKGAQNVQAVTTGQVAFDGIAQYLQYLPVIESGEPIDFVFPTEGAARMEYHYTCRLVNAPNPNATDLFMNWLFTPEAQSALSSVGVYGLHEQAPAPKGLSADLDDVRDVLISPTPMSEANQVTTDAIDLAKRVFG